MKAEERILVAWWFVTRWTGRTERRREDVERISYERRRWSRTEEDEGDAGFGVDPSLGPSVRSFVSWVSSSSSTSHILVSWFSLVWFSSSFRRSRRVICTRNEERMGRMRMIWGLVNTTKEDENGDCRTMQRILLERQEPEDG